ncbi:hypothetical protein AXF42_Ash017879 [Apostasia shenzhenica]|uniref:Uncharacterized protein n=1 Tax=Apostasia shenzhenica TaxID=1088818 RepID=A0A2I0AY44_9ASPA|nr:hypothetical protein AXF42_Ash017879 [Apostasia shenzhenica]
MAAALMEQLGKWFVFLLEGFKGWRGAKTDQEDDGFEEENGNAPSSVQDRGIRVTSRGAKLPAVSRPSPPKTNEAAD